MQQLRLLVIFVCILYFGVLRKLWRMFAHFAYIGVTSVGYELVPVLLTMLLNNQHVTG